MFGTPLAALHFFRLQVLGQGRFGRVLLGMREDNGELLAVKEVSLQVLVPPSLESPLWFRVPDCTWKSNTHEIVL